MPAAGFLRFTAARVGALPPRGGTGHERAAAGRLRPAPFAIVLWDGGALRPSWLPGASRPLGRCAMRAIVGGVMTLHKTNHTGTAVIL